MEIVAMDMKVLIQRSFISMLVFIFFCLLLVQLRGMYIARQLSFAGVSFSIDEISLTPKFISMYDKAVEFVSL